LNKHKYTLLTLLILLFVFQSANAQLLPVDTVFNKKKLTAVVTVGSTVLVGTVVALNYAWYSDYPRSPWHEFNDNDEWLQMDKMGHLTTSYFLGKVGYDLLRWSGVSHKKSIWYGGSMGLVYLTSIEILDAFSTNWGFSWGDMAANTIGAGLYMGQAALWKEQRIAMKFSFHQTDYADIRPDLLGSTYIENLIKDYNGQTYWASVNIYSFLKKESRFPKWLNVAVGYGAEGMVGSYYNPSNLPHFDRYRQYYLSLDIDFTRIPTKSKFLKTILNGLSFIKFPMPTIEFSEKGAHFYPIYF